MTTWQMNDEAFEMYAEAHKQIISQMITNFLFIADPEPKQHVSELAVLAH